MSDPTADYWARRRATLPGPADSQQRELTVVRTNDDQELLCPLCGDSWTHVEGVHVSARGEDGPINEITVDAINGAVRTNLTTAGPMGAAVGEGRRQRISLTGTCETCGGQFALVFTQHKGVTYVEWQPKA